MVDLPSPAGSGPDSGAECSASANSESSHDSCDMHAHDGQLMASQHAVQHTMIDITPTYAPEWRPLHPVVAPRSIAPRLIAEIDAAVCAGVWRVWVALD